MSIPKPTVTNAAGAETRQDGREMDVAAVTINGSYAQLATFAKCSGWPIPPFTSSAANGQFEPLLEKSCVQHNCPMPQRLLPWSKFSSPSQNK